MLTSSFLCYPLLSRSTLGSSRLGALLVLCQALGCNQAAPTNKLTGGGSANDASAGTHDDPMPAPQHGTIADYFPLAHGATWSYLHVSMVDGQWLETMTMVRTMRNGKESFLVEDTEDRAGELSIGTWQRVGTTVSRVYREQFDEGQLESRITYDPGFVRFDTTWDAVGKVTISPYVREERRSDIPAETMGREMRFTVLAIDASVEVPAGRFDNCIQVERTRTDNDETTIFWFAKDVGKVRQERLDTGTYEELTTYSLP